MKNKQIYLKVVFFFLLISRLALTQVRWLLGNNFPCEVKRVLGADIILHCLSSDSHLKGISRHKHHINL